MDKYALQNVLQDFIAEFLRSKGLDLVEIVSRYEGRDLVVRILTDKPEGGITVGECASLNRELGLILDEKDIIQEKYTLEVSSPGLDRPLKIKSDFLRCLNKQARFFLNSEVNGKMELEGGINKADDNAVYVQTALELVEVPLSSINKAKLIF